MQGNPFFNDPGICRDSNAGGCLSWSKNGECENNPEYMKVQCPSIDESHISILCSNNFLSSFAENMRFQLQGLRTVHGARQGSPGALLLEESSEIELPRV